MSSDIPSVADLKQAVESGQRITPQDVSAISQAESDLTGRGPVRGGPAATAQSLAMRQMNFDSKFEEVSQKPQKHITRLDARKMQATEGRAFNKRPGQGSASAQVRSIADRNASLSLPPDSANLPVQDNQPDAEEWTRNGVQLPEPQGDDEPIPRQNPADELQSCANQLDDIRRESIGHYQAR